ncbi:MAG: DUF3052 family protein [Thermoleophilaceae bacterium]
MAPEHDYSHRTTIQKLGVEAGVRLELGGDVGAELRREVKVALGRGPVRTGLLDGALVLVHSAEEAEAVLARLRPRLRDEGYLWLVTRRRGQEGYVNQMDLIPAARRVGLIDNKTCSIDEQRSGIRFVVPRALRGGARQSAA